MRIFFILLFAAIVLFGTITAAQATTHYVDASQSATTGPWAGSFEYLQDAITAAAPFDTIKVAQGLYRPDDTLLNPDTGNRESSFELKVNVEVIGGFRGGSTNPDDWDPTTYVNDP